MSHVTQVKTVFQDLDALETACERLGLELVRGKKTFGWWGDFVGDSSQYGDMTPDRMGKCDHAIEVKGTSPRNGSSGPWSIGVVGKPDGSYGIYYDTFGSAGQALSSRIGSGDAPKLKREYAAEVATRKASKKLARDGWKVGREDLPNGGIRLKLRRR